MTLTNLYRRLGIALLVAGSLMRWIQTDKVSDALVDALERQVRAL